MSEISTGEHEPLSAHEKFAQEIRDKETSGEIQRAMELLGYEYSNTIGVNDEGEQIRYGHRADGSSIEIAFKPSEEVRRELKED